MDFQKKDLTPQPGTLISHIAKILQNEAEVARNQFLTARFRFSIGWDEFLPLYIQAANSILQRRGSRSKFAVDDNNRLVIGQLWLYMNYDERFEGDLDKGLMLQGAIGVGKSLLLESYTLLQNRLAGYVKAPNGGEFKGVRFVHANELAESIKSADGGAKGFASRNLAIDDLGREPKNMMNFGNVCNPISELITMRAEASTLTHATSNYNLATLSSDDFYGPMVGDRIRSMFNFITVGGRSRRV